jgi:hypothetical protein
VIVAEHDGKKGWQLEGPEREESMRWIFPEQVLKVIDENHLCQTQKLKQTPLSAF